MFLTTYQLNWRRVAEPLVLEHEGATQVAVRSGPLRLSTTVPVLHLGDGSAGMTLDEEAIMLPDATYLLIQQHGDSMDSAWLHHGAPLAAAEFASAIELLCPKLLAKRHFEGVINVPGSITFAPPGPLALTARPAESAEELQENFRRAMSAIRSMPADERGRFRLSARWFARGMDAQNPVDKLLFWYVCLEVFPALGSAEVPNAVRDYLAAALSPAPARNELKEKLGIGPIASLRAEIVHRGLAAVPAGEDKELTLRLQQLEAIVRACSKLSLGIQPVAELAPYLSSSAEV